MKKTGTITLFLLCCLPVHVFAQRVLLLMDSKTGKTVEIREGDKVMLAFRTPQREVDNQPADVFVLQTQDLQDSTFVHFKTRIRTITDSTITLKNGREMRLGKLAGIRRLSAGKQVLRTTANVVGYATMLTGWLLFSENVFGGVRPIPLWSTIALGLGGATMIEFAKNEVPARHLKRWRVSVRNP